MPRPSSRVYLWPLSPFMGVPVAPALFTLLAVCLFTFPVVLETYGEVWWVLLEVLLHGDGNVGTEEVGTHVECQERVL